MARRYLETHGWLTFRYDLREVTWQTWLLLGEAQSKCEHLAGVPLRPAVATRLHSLYLAKGVHATTAIEGNTLTEEDVLKQIEGRLELPASKAYMRQEIENVIKACEDIFAEAVANHETGALSAALIRNYNEQVLLEVPVEQGVVPGAFREYSVGVANYRAVPAEDVAHLVDRLGEWLGDEAFRPGPHANIAFAIIRAVLCHLYIAWIHPFGDGNGRTARLLEFYILVCAGVPSPAAHLLSNHYNATRSEYYRQLDRASRTGQVTPFLEYAISGFVEGLRQQIDSVRSEQLAVTWENYVHEILDGSTDTAVRQRHLLLDLGKREGALPAAQIAQLTPRLARDYATKTSKTLQRDLNALVERGLVVRTSTGYAARTDIVQAYVPQRARPAV